MIARLEGRAKVRGGQTEHQEAWRTYIRLSQRRQVSALPKSIKFSLEHCGNERTLLDSGRADTIGPHYGAKTKQPVGTGRSESVDCDSGLQREEHDRRDPAARNRNRTAQGSHHRGRLLERRHARAVERDGCAPGKGRCDSSGRRWRRCGTVARSAVFLSGTESGKRRGVAPGIRTGYGRHRARAGCRPGIRPARLSEIARADCGRASGCRVRLAIFGRPAARPLFLALRGEHGPDSAVRYCYEFETHRYGDLLQGIPSRSFTWDSTLMRSV